MKSFGALLRKLRGATSLREAAKQAGVSLSYFANLESGRRIPDEKRARSILRGFGLPPAKIDRLILEVKLLDHGLVDDELRSLVLDLVQNTVPPEIKVILHALYREYRNYQSD